MIALDPNETHDLVLWHQQELPAERRVVFVFRYLSARETSAVAKAFAAYKDAKDDQAMMEAVKAGLRIALVGWRNLRDRKGEPVAFDVDRVDELLTAHEIQEITVRLLPELAVSELDKKKSAWPSSSRGGSSAKGATADAGASGSVPPPPPSGSPPASSAPPAKG